MTITGEESAGGLLLGMADNYQLRYEAEIDVFEESFDASISSDGIIAVEVPFEEDVDGDAQPTACIPRSGNFRQATDQCLYP